MIELSNKICFTLEKALNVAAVIPGVSKTSCEVRLVAAVIQAAVGAIFGFVAVLFALTGKDGLKVEELGVTHIIHAACNGLRALIERQISKSVWGNLMLFGIELMKHDGFAPFMPYAEKLSIGELPIRKELSSAKRKAKGSC